MSSIQALDPFHWCIILSFDKIFEMRIHTPIFHIHAP